MTQATNTTLGEIKLAGDLAGDGGAQIGTNPQLSHISGLVAGQYNAANITVDTKGRIVSIESTTPDSVLSLIPDASTTTKGRVQLGPNIHSTGDCQIYVKDASVVDAGVVRIGSGINVSGGVISVPMGNLPVATTTTIGAVKVPTSGNIVIDGSGAISVPNASTTVKGAIQVGPGLTIDGFGVLSYNTSTLPIATETVLGCVKQGAGVSIAGDGTLTINVNTMPKATTSTLGVVKIGLGINVDGNGVISVALPPATETVLGGIKIGNGLDIEGSGICSVDPTEILATTSTAGCVQIGSNLNVASGVISVPDATTSTKGVMSILSGTGLSITSGELSILNATTSTKGIVQIGSNISVAAGTISVPNASTTVKGVVQVGSGVNVSSGIISIPDATTSTKGIVQVGSNISVSSGVISIPNATDVTKGVVSVPTGNGLSVTSGVLSVTDATTLAKGVVTIGNNIAVDNGTISVPVASSTTKGVVQLGSGIAVDVNGVISANMSDASYTAKGILQVDVNTGLLINTGVLSTSPATSGIRGTVIVGSNINVDAAGTISVPAASGTTTYGVVKSANTSNISITSGSIDVGTNIPKLTSSSTFTQAQAAAINAPSYTASWTPSFSASNIFNMTLTGNVTINNPTDITPGTTVLIILKQDATGGRTASFGSYFKFAEDETNTISLVANSYSVILVNCVASNVLVTTISRGFI